MLGYIAIDPKVCQEAVVWEKKQPKEGYHAYMIIWKQLVGECLQCMKESTNDLDKNIE